MSEEVQNNWNEYSRLVLKELETLSDGVSALQEEIKDIKTEITKLQLKESRIDEIKDWKDKVNEISSPTQMKEYINKVDELNAFKIKAAGIFIAVQFIMAVVAFLMKFS